MKGCIEEAFTKLRLKVEETVMSVRKQYRKALQRVVRQALKELRASREATTRVLKETAPTLLQSLMDQVTDLRAHSKEIHSLGERALLELARLSSLIDGYKELLNGRSDPLTAEEVDIIDISNDSNDMDIEVVIEKYISDIISTLKNVHQMVPLQCKLPPHTPVRTQATWVCDSIEAFGQTPLPTQHWRDVYSDYNEDVKDLLNGIIQRMERDLGADVAPNVSGVLSAVSTILFDQLTPVVRSNAVQVVRFYSDSIFLQKGIIETRRMVHSTLEKSLESKVVTALHQYALDTVNNEYLGFAYEFMVQCNLYSVTDALEHMRIKAEQSRKRKELVLADLMPMNTELISLAHATDLLTDLVRDQPTLTAGELQQHLRAMQRANKLSSNLLQDSLPPLFQDLQESVIRSDDSTTESGRLRGPSRRILEKLLEYEAEPTILLTEYSDVLRAVHALCHYIPLCRAEARAAHTDTGFINAIIDTLEVLLPPTPQYTLVPSPPRACHDHVFRQLRDRYASLLEISKLTACSLVSSSLIDAYPIRKLAVPCGDLLSGTTYSLYLDCNAEMEDPQLSQARRTVQTTLQQALVKDAPKIFADTAMAIRSARNGVSILVRDSLEQKRNRALKGLVLGLKERSMMRYEDIMGHLRRCIDSEASARNTLTAEELGTCMRDGIVECFSRERHTYRERITAVSNLIESTSRQLNAVIDQHCEVVDKREAERDIDNIVAKAVEKLQNLWSSIVTQRLELAQAAHTKGGVGLPLTSYWSPFEPIQYALSGASSTDDESEPDVPYLMPNVKYTSRELHHVVDCIQSATEGSLFYDLNDSVLEEMFLTLHFSLTKIEVAFNNHPFELSLSTLSAVLFGPAQIKGREYYRLSLVARNTLDIYTNQNTCLTWVSALRSILAYGKQLGTLRELWLAYKR
ncbi:hypothetical protein GMRT_15341 [Giardia muris]|uniref:Uncharacterized protein n=1 Tax=Giardia muris TaxID=5742 RepID=A0A4Z1SSM8_GIAMU|nr:hypothetical protein GMRT_15341 [Giardia muris]|eukprot:TNJ28922.1 hypothetical protein GMRT_15341 [Giardia muris]